MMSSPLFYLPVLVHAHHGFNDALRMSSMMIPGLMTLKVKNGMLSQGATCECS